jgi:hypothetical protein
MVQRGVVKLQYVGTDEQVADVLTKPLSRVKFEYFSRQAWYSSKGPPSKGGVMLMILWYPDQQQVAPLGFYILGD